MRRFGLTGLACVVAILAAPAVHAEEPPEPLPELELLRALPIEYSEPLEPSGLTADHRGHLHTVCDKHDDAIFELYNVGTGDHTSFDLASGESVVRARVAFPLKGDRTAVSERGLDLEGIDRDPDGGFVLASEGTGRLLRVERGGGGVHPLTPDLRPFVADKGLLVGHNAGLEGVAIRGDGSYLACAERQERGILAIRPSGDGVAVRGVRVAPTLVRPPEGRSPDFSDLEITGPRLYALERNAEAICWLNTTDGSFAERRCWSFANTVDRPELRYADRTFGMAEGLAIERERVYVVLDNNQIPREADPEDRRPLLLVFRRPRDMK